MSRRPRLVEWWPVAFGVGIGAQLTLSFLVLFGPAQVEPAVADQLTNRGRVLFQPEHDVSIYALGCALTAGLITIFAIFLQRRTLGKAGEIREQFTRRGAAQLLALGVLASAQIGLLFILRRVFIFDGSAPPAFALLLLALPILGSLALGLGLIGGLLPPPPQAFVRWLGESAKVAEWPRFSFHRGFDIALPILLCSVVYIPLSHHIAGAIFMREQFHHWDFFAMGPALAFHHGAALGTDAYTQYGVGWPLVFHALSSIIPISYGNFILIGSLYASLYFIGVYALLRLMLRSALWAAIGVLLSLSLQLFHGIEAPDIMWKYPSSTVIRSPMDVWFFFALLLRLRTSNRAWALCAGVLVGLAVLFETDTGLYLAIVFAAYWLFSLGLTNSRVKAKLVEAFAAFLVGAVVLLFGLACASRGTFVRKDFWIGWTESLRGYGAGISMLPIATVPDATLLLFAFIIIVYFAVMGAALVALLRRDSTPPTVLLGCIASYGLLVMILFVGRSHPFNIFHVAVPFGIVVTAIICRINERAITYGTVLRIRASRNFWQSLTLIIPWSALAAVVVWLLLTPAFRNYPGILQSLWAKPLANSLSLFHNPADVCGLPEAVKDYIYAFDGTTQFIRDCAAEGHSVAVLDEVDTIFYLAAGTKPWWRYSPSLTSITRRSEVARLTRELEERSPKYVLIRGSDMQAQMFDAGDVWNEAHSAVAQLYSLEGDTGIFQIWRRNQK